MKELAINQTQMQVDWLDIFSSSENLKTLFQTGLRVDCNVSRVF